MKKGFYVLAFVSCVVSFVFPVSCNDNYPTFEELKSAEKKEINRIIAEKGIQVLKEYPANGVFGENEFVELSSGIYLHVTDSGNGNRAQYNATTVLVRMDVEFYDIETDSIQKVSYFSNNSYPFEFKYGHAYSVRSAHNTSSPDAYTYFFSLAMEAVLSYVGENSEVKLLVPGYSEISNYEGGSVYQTSSRYRYIPIYYDRVRYTYY
ncbi:MAG: DUF4827 domain-containing protein [Tannerella sp.]|jgi:hypothetical protein|nr:DUF4827 domain-containing protein [Tannerella sp.]